MNVLVLGAGSVGLTMGALLTRQGHKVSIVARERHVSRIRTNGIRLTGTLGDIQSMPAAAEVVVRDLPTEEMDLILVTVKSFDTLSAIASCGRLIGTGTVVVSVQNGLGNLEVLEGALGTKQPLFGCVSLFGCEIAGPAAVHLTSHACEAKLGAFGVAAHRYRLVAETLAASLTQAGLRTTISTDFQTDIWTKFLMNAMTNALSAIEGKTLAELFAEERTVLTMDALLEEIFPVAQHVGVALPWHGPVEFMDFYKHNILPRFGAHRPSMAQDLSLGRRTEIESLNGHLVQLAKRYERSTPVNAYLTKLVEKKEHLAKSAAVSRATEAVDVRKAQYA